MLFIVRKSNSDPDPEEVGVESRLFAIAQAQKSKVDVDAAQVRLEDAQQKYDAETDWNSYRVISAAEEHHKKVGAVHSLNLIKLAWETRREWEKRIKVDPRLRPQPWKDNKSEWLSFFKPRQVTPSI